MELPIIADALDGSSSLNNVRNGQRKGLVDAQVARQLLQIKTAVVHISSWCARLIFKRARLDGVAAKAPPALEGASS